MNQDSELHLLRETQQPEVEAPDSVSGPVLLLVYMWTKADCLASLLPSAVMSRSPTRTPIFFRNAVGGSPPAKIQTKSLGISCDLPLTSRMTELRLNSTGIELKMTLTFPFWMFSWILFSFRSFRRVKHSFRYDN